jgi:hypothetical protein
MKGFSREAFVLLICASVILDQSVVSVFEKERII